MNCPSELPSEVAKFSATAVPLITPEIEALLKHVASLEVIEPSMEAWLVPWFGPCVSVPEKLKGATPFTLEVNAPVKDPLTVFTFDAVQVPTSEAPQPEARME